MLSQVFEETLSPSARAELEGLSMRNPEEFGSLVNEILNPAAHDHSDPTK